MTNLTNSEIAVLKSLANNYYGEQGDGVWSFAINESSTPSGLEGKALAGVVGSLCKKGMIVSEEYEKNEWVIYMRPPGAVAITELGLCQS